MTTRKSLLKPGRPSVNAEEAPKVVVKEEPKVVSKEDPKKGFSPGGPPSRRRVSVQNKSPVVKEEAATSKDPPATRSRFSSQSKLLDLHLIEIVGKLC